MGDSGTHKHPRVRGWFVRRPRYVPRSTPTGASRLNRAKRFFARMTERRIRRGSFKSVEELERAIEGYLGTHNENPRPSPGPKTPASSRPRSSGLANASPRRVNK